MGFWWALAWTIRTKWELRKRDRKRKKKAGGKQ